MPTTIRPFEPADAPAVAALRRRVFRHSRRTAPGELERYLHEVFFESPWRDPQLPSWVAGEGGEVVGFIGVVPRPLALGERALRGAVASQVMVAPERRGVTGVQLLRRAFSGAHDLLYADIATPPLARLWEKVGGSTAHHYAFQWTRPLRPAREAAARLGSAPLARGARLVARPLFGAIDSVAGAVAMRPEPGSTAAGLDDPALIAETLPRIAPKSMVRPAYDAPRLAWLLERAAERWSDHDVERRVVRDPGGAVAGWFIWLNGGGGTAQLLQLHAAPGRHGEVLRHLFRDAWKRGALAVRGRYEPSLAEHLQAAGVRWERVSPGMLLHAREGGLLCAVLRGDALLSGLDGEWWLDFSRRRVIRMFSLAR